jgi:hypothetical protein
MKHFASRAFWEAYDRLPKQVRDLADRNDALLKENPRHPSLQFKRVGRFWSVRVGLRYRALERTPTAIYRRSIKNCESLHALLLRHFKVLRHFGESFLAMKHAKRKIGHCSPTNAGFAALA